MRCGGLDGGPLDELHVLSHDQAALRQGSLKPALARGRETPKEGAPVCMRAGSGHECYTPLSWFIWERNYRQATPAASASAATTSGNLAVSALDVTGNFHERLLRNFQHRGEVLDVLIGWNRLVQLDFLQRAFFHTR